MPPSSKQLAMLHVAKKQLALDDAAYRAVLAGVAGVESSKDLTNYGLDKVLDVLKAMGFEPPAKDPKRELGRRDGMATPAQLGLIRALWRTYSGNDDDKKLSKWLAGTFQVSAVRFLDPDVASNAIEALKKMAARPRHTEVQDAP